jgi:APA family basic amino acid/polyamine antiporter
MCIVGVFKIDAQNWTSDFAPNGATGILRGAAMMFFAYIGFDMISVLAEEVKEPQKNIPIGVKDSSFNSTQ